VERQTDVQIDSNGRVVIPKNIRKQLGIDGESATVRVSVEVLE